MASSVIDLKNAVRNGDKDLVVKLLDQGVDPNQFGSHANNATSPLMVACVNGHLDLINLLIDRGAKVNLQNGRHETALSKVTSIDMTQSVMLEVVGVLLQNNAKVRFGYDYQKSAMMIACEKGNVELVRLMLPYDSWDDPEYTNTMFDVVNTSGDTKVMELLLTSKHITMDHEELANWVHRACVTRDDPEMVSIMLDRNPELVDCTCEFYSDGYTPLMRASVRRRTKIVKMLLERGANIDYQCQLDSPDEVAGFSALMVAVKSVQMETVELLLEEGAAVDLTDKTGRTALIIACQNGQTELSRMLIAKRANVDHVDCRGRYPLLYAVEFAVEENCYSSKTISPYADNNYYQLIELLLERGAKADFVSSNKETAQKLLQANAPTFLPLVNSANLKCPRLMAILEMDLGTTVEDKDQESEKMSRKRDRSSSIELSEERAPKTFRSNPPSSVSHFPEEDYRESPSAAPVAISQQSTIGGTQVPIQLAAATFTQEPDPYAVNVANIDDSTVLEHFKRPKPGSPEFNLANVTQVLQGLPPSRLPDLAQELGMKESNIELWIGRGSKPKASWAVLKAALLNVEASLAERIP